MTDTTQATTNPDQDKLDAIEISLQFTVKDVNLLLGVLGNAPFVASAGLIQSIQQQGSPQVQAALAADPSVVTDATPSDSSAS
jgi:hypothetical protein